MELFFKKLNSSSLSGWKMISIFLSEGNLLQYCSRLKPEIQSALSMRSDDPIMFLWIFFRLKILKRSRMIAIGLQLPEL